MPLCAPRGQENDSVERSERLRSVLAATNRAGDIDVGTCPRSAGGGEALGVPPKGVPDRSPLLVEPKVEPCQAAHEV